MEVEKYMNEFNDWLLFREFEILYLIEFVVFVYYKFVYIYLFIDGNGRIGRFVMNFILMRVGFLFVIIRFQDRYEYYEYLNLVNYGDMRSFIRFVVRCTDRIIDEYLIVTIIYFVGYNKFLEFIDVYELNEDFYEIFSVEKE